MSRPRAMKNPAHPGELIRDNIDELGLSVTEAAKGFGVVLRQQLHTIIAGRGPITPEMAVRLKKSIGRTDTWLRMPMNYDLAQSPRATWSVSSRGCVISCIRFVLTAGGTKLCKRRMALAPGT